MYLVTVVLAQWLSSVKCRSNIHTLCKTRASWRLMCMNVVNIGLKLVALRSAWLKRTYLGGHELMRLVLSEMRVTLITFSKNMTEKYYIIW